MVLFYLAQFICCYWGPHWSPLMFPEGAEEVLSLDVSQWRRGILGVPYQYSWGGEQSSRFVGTKRIPVLGHLLLDPIYWFHSPIHISNLKCMFSFLKIFLSFWCPFIVSAGVSIL